MDRSPRRILVVDDDPRILAGLKNRLWGFRRVWKLTFAQSGAAALAEMECHAFDAIISDLRMPVMDGAQLLTEVARRYPDTHRIILSGQSDASASTRALAVAHCFLSKPCPPGELESALAAIAELRKPTQARPGKSGHDTPGVAAGRAVRHEPARRMPALVQRERAGRR